MTYVCTYRQGAQFVEVWVEGSKYKELSASQERLSVQREELEKQRKILNKRKPPSGGGTVTSGGRSSPAQPGKTGFVKPQVPWSGKDSVCVCVSTSLSLSLSPVSLLKNIKRKMNCLN